MPPPEPTLPTQIGRYHVVRLLGQGAMGRVYLAHDPVLDRDVAIKLLRDDLGIPPEHKEALLVRMRQEARASARVSHPNMVELHDMGEDADLGLYLVFEYVDGATLKERLGRGPLGPEAVAKLARELGAALSTAHDAGVLHRDIKPENVMLARAGAKIADFGIARVPDSTLTREGGLLGTPAYSAPESIGQSRFSPLSDQFSLATTLWEALSGRRAFPGEDAMAVASRIATEEPPRIAEVCGVDSHVDLVFSRALSKNENARFPSCEDFGRALGEALELKRRAAMPTLPDAVHREQDAARRARGGVGVLLAGAALGGVAAYAAFTWRDHARPVERPPNGDVVLADAGTATAPQPSASAAPRGKRIASASASASATSTHRGRADAGATDDAAAPNAIAAAADSGPDDATAASTPTEKVREAGSLEPGRRTGSAEPTP